MCIVFIHSAPATTVNADCNECIKLLHKEVTATIDTRKLNKIVFPQVHKMLIYLYLTQLMKKTTSSFSS